MRFAARSTTRVSASITGSSAMGVVVERRTAVRSRASNSAVPNVRAAGEIEQRSDAKGELVDPRWRELLTDP
jgi:hypothetical protein